MPLSKSEDDLAHTQIHSENIILILIEAKGQLRTYKSHKCIWHIIKWWYTCVPSVVWLRKRTKSCIPNTKPCQKPYNFDLEVKGQCCIRTLWMYATHHLMGIHHVRNMVCQCQSKISYGSDTQTDGQKEWLILIYPTEFRSQGVWLFGYCKRKYIRYLSIDQKYYR